MEFTAYLDHADKIWDELTFIEDGVAKELRYIVEKLVYGLITSYSKLGDSLRKLYNEIFKQDLF